MYKTIQMLAELGQNASIKQYQTIQEMLLEHNISEQEINNLIESNTPLICAWIPQENEPDDEPNDECDEDKDHKEDKDKPDGSKH